MLGVEILTTDSRTHSFEEDRFRWKIADRGVMVQEIPSDGDTEGVYMFPWTNVVKVYEWKRGETDADV